MEKKIKYPYNYSKRIATEATQAEITQSIIEMLTKANLKKLTPEFNVEVFLKFARLKFSTRNYDKTDSILTKCHKLTDDNRLPDNHEIYYWKGRLKEAQGEHFEAAFFLNLSLDHYKYNPNLISKKEILEAIAKYVRKN